VSSTVKPRSQLDVSEQLTNGQSDDVRVVLALLCDGPCVQSQLVVEIGRPRQYIGIVVEECNNLRNAI